MKKALSLFFLAASFWAAAQPANDECAGAINLPLSTPPVCPAGGSVSNTFNYTNIGATPTTPYPTFSNCIVGGSTSAPAAEVWFSFTATANQLTITIGGGLATPNLVVFQGSNCQFLNAIQCARGSASPLTITINTIPGQTYFLMVSGGTINDQANFSLTMTSTRDCNPCLQSTTFVAFPPPLNGTYNSGQTVNFCFTITGWDVTSTIEWLHAVTVQFGAGWDLSTLTTTPPPSCGGDGAWGWYNSWVSCNTGQTFGPGFAYDSSSGVGCGGSPNDGNPGNNWGDGVGPCATIGDGTPAQVQFCWSVTVASCPGISTGTDLSMNVSVWSDGDSGSWTVTGCNSGNQYNFLASAVCCDDANPSASSTPTRCPQASNGTITAEGGVPGKPYNYYIFNSAGQLVFQALGVVGPITANNLPAGSYSVLAVNVESGCQRSRLVDIAAGAPPQAIASNGGPYCPGDPISLQGSFTFGSPATQVTYQWTGPGGYTSNQQNPTNATQSGTYTLVVNVDGCPSAPATTNVVFQPAFANVTASPATVCPGAPSTLTASGALSYEWSTGQTGSSIVVNPNQTTTYTVTATNSFGCSTVRSVTVSTHPVPALSISAPATGCDGSITALFAVGAPFTQYLWSTGQTGNPAAVDLHAPQSTFSVTATTSQGCTAVASTTIMVFPNPVATAAASPATICRGQTSTLTASGGAIYNWSNMASGASITVAPTVTTTYQVTVTGVDGCQSVASTTVNVVQPIANPVPVCGAATPNSVSFSWPAVPDATGYTVNVLSGQTGTLSGTTFTVNGLLPGTPVTIQVTANSGTICPNTTATITCSTLNCPPVSVDIAQAPNYCLDAGNQADTLIAIISGGTGGGTRTWSGPGIINTAAGVFHADTAGIGAHPIVLTYTEGACIYRDTMTIRVFSRPDADFIAVPDTICLTDSLMLTYTGAADTSAVYTWFFDGGIALPGVGIGPHSVSWPTTGSKLVSLVVLQNGCISDTVRQAIVLDAPLAAPAITCGPATTTSASFVWNTVPGADSYSVEVISGPQGTILDTTYTITGLQPQQTVEIRVTASGNTICGPISATASCTALPCPNFTINILPVPDICLVANTPTRVMMATVSGGAGTGSGTWSGPGIVNAAMGVFDPNVAGPGQHTLTLTYTEGPCTGTASRIVRVFSTPSAQFSVQPTAVCTGQAVNITYSGNAGGSANYTWNFDGGIATPGAGTGPHSVVWAVQGSKTIRLTVVEDGCTSTTFSQEVTVEQPLASPIINCATTNTEIIFSWNDVPGASGYAVALLQGTNGIQNGNSYAISNLMPGDSARIRVTALNNGPCGPSSAELSCIAQACPSVNIQIAPVAPICLEASTPIVNLNTTITGGAGNGIGMLSGPGVIPGTTTFDPHVAGPGAHTLQFTYQEGPCSWNSSITINVAAKPTANFTVVSPICITDASSATYAGNAGAGAAYDWSFGTGTATPGTGQGPHSVRWSSVGAQSISLTVTENGCISTPFSLIVDVQDTLATPIISCSNSTTTAVSFNWLPVSGANQFEVTVLSGHTGLLSGNSYAVSGLMPEEVVQIQVRALGNTVCGPSQAVATCAAAACPNVSIAFGPLPQLCFSPNLPSQTLSATISGASGGTGLWSGPGVTNATAGTFSPALAGIGQHTITYTYTLGPCVTTATRIVEVLRTPEAAFTLSADTVCTGQQVTVTYNGNAAPGDIYTWSFAGGNASPGTGIGPHTVSWPTGGLRAVSLTVTSDSACSSPTLTRPVQVVFPLAPPVITCSATPSQVTFSWNPVTGATQYQVTVLSGPQGIQTGNTYTVSGLNPGDQVSIRVTASNNGPCQPSSAQASCTAQACPPVSIALTSTEPVCLTASTLPIQLGATVSGGSGGGTGNWSGAGVSATGLFNPAAAGPGVHTLLYQYQEGNCTYRDSVSIVVRAQPQASLDSPSALCVGSQGVVSFTGVAPPGAIFTWNFDGGTALPGTGAGPHTVSWSTPGTKTITLTVNDNNCVSALATRIVQVDAPLAPPQISCDATSTSVTFNWLPVSGATGYQVSVLSGPQGVLNGTSYAITGLSPGQAVEIEVTATGAGACGNSRATASCVAQNCPTLLLVINGTLSVCAGAPAQVAFNFAGSSQGPFTVTYQVNGGPPVTSIFTNGQTLPVNTAVTTTITALSIVDNALPSCSYSSNASWTVFVTQPQRAGTAVAPQRLCAGADVSIVLSDLLVGSSPGGTWTETSALPSTGGAFNPANGMFRTLGQAAGTYLFTYTVSGPVPCPQDQATVTVLLEPAPRADAGPDQLLTCNMGMVSIGGNQTDTGPGISYLWSSTTPGVVIANATARIIEVAQPGVYRLVATNAAGCVGTDEVEVRADFEAPIVEVERIPISCFGSQDGGINVVNITGGRAPYELALNGGNFGSNRLFTGLGARTHTLIVRDAKGCFTEIMVELTEPPVLDVIIATNLAPTANNLIEQGERVMLQALVSGGSGIATIAWQSDSVFSNALSVEVFPATATTYRVVVIDKNGCRAEDDITIFVRRMRKVFIPSAFSPNEDGVNDIFTIFAEDNQVTRIRQLLIFNRWGEAMYEAQNFPPNDLASGWDGTYRGQFMNPGVYVFWAEIEFADGEVILYKGDVSLIR